MPQQNDANALQPALQPPPTQNHQATTQHYFLDGSSGKLTAVQIVISQPKSHHQDHDHDRLLPPRLNEEGRWDDDDNDDENDDENEEDQPIVAAAGQEISNGFVKDGRQLPYVFEASDSGGDKKKSSKILPVCGVCGKRFVCVTTMKRHLVTHTGEKPFACKVCGKQYTQKGNLRVHERTHRNDRPFECNICRQKFYRKEPMQKHQWRQHGIVHLKARPPPHCTPSATNTTGPPTALSAGSIYNSIVDKIKNSSLESFNESSRHLDSKAASSSLHIPPPPQAHKLKVSNSKPPTDLAEDDTPQRPTGTRERSYSDELDLTSIKLPSLAVTSSSSVPKDIGEEVNNDALPCEFKNAKTISDSQSSSTTSFCTPSPSPQPLKLKKILAEAYQREVEESPSPLQQHEPDLSRPPRSHQHQCVECQCKSCGRVFPVDDPYNFRCPGCQARYTSLPTHMIADPLQCIGCQVIFAHKPALKAHQAGTDFVEGGGVPNRAGNTERPFRCCKCGYGFRQKAHLQKHQWRIHRRKLDSDGGGSGGENSKFQQQQQQHSISSVTPQGAATTVETTTITVQDLIDRGVERGGIVTIRAASTPSPPPQNFSFRCEDDLDSNGSDRCQQPLDLSPTKHRQGPPSDEPQNLVKEFVAKMPTLPSANTANDGQDVSLPTPSPSIQRRSSVLENNPLLNQRPYLDDETTTGNGLIGEPTRPNKAASPLFKRHRRLSNKKEEEAAGQKPFESINLNLPPWISITKTKKSTNCDETLNKPSGGLPPKAQLDGRTV